MKPNDKTVRLVYLVPIMNEHLDYFGGGSILSTLDENIWFCLKRIENCDVLLRHIPFDYGILLQSHPVRCARKTEINTKCDGCHFITCEIEDCTHSAAQYRKCYFINVRTYVASTNSMECAQSWNIIEGEQMLVTRKTGLSFRPRCKTNTADYIVQNRWNNQRASQVAIVTELKVFSRVLLFV